MKNTILSLACILACSGCAQQKISQDEIMLRLNTNYESLMSDAPSSLSLLRHCYGMTEDEFGDGFLRAMNDAYKEQSSKYEYLLTRAEARSFGSVLGQRGLFIFFEDHAAEFDYSNLTDSKQVEACQQYEKESARIAAMNK